MNKALKITGYSVLTGAALMLAGAAIAHGRMGPQAMGPGGPGGFAKVEFATLDVDADGQITEADLLAMAEAKFGEADTDGNGALDAEEIAAGAKARFADRFDGDAPRGRRGMDADEMMAKITERMMDRRDADKDGALSFAEMEPAKGFGRMIDRFDTDDDNAISEAEFDEAKAEMEKRAGRGDERRGPNGGKRR